MGINVLRKIWVEDKSEDRIEDVWTTMSAPSAARAPLHGRILQAEETGALTRAVLELIEGSKEVVLVSSFLFADAETERALLEAAKRGVRVYLLVATEAKLDKEIRGEDGFSIKTIEEHKKLLDRVAGWIYVRSAEHFHAKLVITDPKSLPRGVLLTANLTKEALTRNHELGVWLNAAEVKALTALFTWAFWESAQRELLSAGNLPPVTAAERFAIPGPSTSIVATAAERRDIRATVLDIIRSARQTLVVTTFGIDDREVVDALVDRVNNGIAVTLLVRHPRPAMFATLRDLARAGVDVLGVSEFLHAKAVLADGQRGLVMTSNLQEHGLDKGFEVGVRLSGDDAAALGGLLASWKKGAHASLHASKRVGDVRGLVQMMNGKGYRDVLVESSGESDDGETKVDCCTQFSTARRPAAKALPPGKIYHIIEHRWTIVLPVLMKGAKAIQTPAKGTEPPFPIYQEPSGRRVFAIDDLSHVQAAQTTMGAHGVQAVVLKG